MKNTRRGLWFIAAAFIVLCIAGTALAAGFGQSPSLDNIPLEWAPTDPIASTEGIDRDAYKNARILVKPFTDQRETPAEIGRNMERQAPRYVTTRDNVAAWVTDKFSRVLSATGMHIVGENPTVTIEGEIVKFFVTEQKRYNADVTLKLRVKSKNNDVLWEGMTSGNENRWGRSYRADNYYESLSNALNTAVHAVLKNEDFKRAVQKAK